MAIKLTEQECNTMSTPHSPEVITIWPSGAPGTEHWAQQEQETRLPPANYRFVRNITRPTLTAFLPNSDIANGAAAIVCPGGGFQFVTYDNEGTAVAEWLNARGVAAFVLKYRVDETPADDAAFVALSQRIWAAEPAARDAHFKEITRRIAPHAIADAQQAMRIIRGRAAEWGIAPERVGLIGFSAGARVTVGAALSYDAATRPAFAAPIYGALFEGLDIPADAPPMFIAVSADDPLAAEPCLRLYQAWRAAGQSAELHIYAQGGHGYGMQPRGLPCDTWFERLGDWLASRGLLSRGSE
jgi:acetyl esterase/lipase